VWVGGGEREARVVAALAWAPDHNLAPILTCH
jgi:hypothetical protein